jgi:putative transcriptional regulator
MLRGHTDIPESGRENAKIKETKLAPSAILTHAENKANTKATGIPRKFVMTTKPTFKSDAFEAIHGAAQGLYRAGAVNKATMREFDESCLAPAASLKPTQIKKIRLSNHVSQPVFARYLNTSPSTVQKWETGAKQPSGMALKLLNVVKKHGLDVLA